MSLELTYFAICNYAGFVVFCYIMYRIFRNLLHDLEQEKRESGMGIIQRFKEKVKNAKEVGQEVMDYQMMQYKVGQERGKRWVEEYKAKRGIK